MAVKLTVSKFGDVKSEYKETEIERLLRGCATGYLVKRGEIMIGPVERSIFKTKRGAEKLLINGRGNVVKVCIIEEFPHPDMRD